MCFGRPLLPFFSPAAALLLCYSFFLFNMNDDDKCRLWCCSCASIWMWWPWMRNEREERMEDRCYINVQINMLQGGMMWCKNSFCQGESQEYWYVFVSRVEQSRELVDLKLTLSCEEKERKWNTQTHQKKKKKKRLSCECCCCCFVAAVKRTKNKIVLTTSASSSSFSSSSWVSREFVAFGVVCLFVCWFFVFSSFSVLPLLLFLSLIDSKMQTCNILIVYYVDWFIVL